MGCGPERANLCLLASGALTDNEKAAAENHVAACAGCRQYYEEIKSVAGPLADWETSFSHLEPDQTIQTRWAKDFQATLELVRPPRSALILSIFDWCRDIIWPCRRVWTGLAAIWLAILVVNFSTRATGPSLATKSSRLTAERVWAFLESEGVQAEGAKPGKPPKPSLPPPRSERRPGFLGS
jgi:hypothetical protein